MEQCLSIISDTKTLIIKVDDSKHFKQILDGFLALTEDNKQKKNVVERQVLAL
jgi:hypothetical protein